MNSRSTEGYVYGTHWEGCWTAHHDCALHRVSVLQHALRDLVGLVDRMPNRDSIEQASSGGKIIGAAREALK